MVFLYCSKTLTPGSLSPCRSFQLSHFLLLNPKNLHAGFFIFFLNQSFTAACYSSSVPRSLISSSLSPRWTLFHFPLSVVSSLDFKISVFSLRFISIFLAVSVNTVKNLDESGLNWNYLGSTYDWSIHWSLHPFLSDLSLSISELRV